MEAKAGGGGSLARLLIQVHCNSSILQKLLILQKSIWPTKHKDGQSSLHWNWIYLNSQHKYILNSTLLENFHHLNNWAHRSAKRCFSYRTAFSDSNRNDPHCFSFKSGQLGKHHWGWDREVELSAFYQFPNPHQSLFFSSAAATLPTKSNICVSVLLRH